MTIYQIIYLIFGIPMLIFCFYYLYVIAKRM